MQIYEPDGLPIQSETMQETRDNQTYALFETALNRKIIGDLEKAGARALLFPPLATEKIEFNEAEAVIFENLKDFDWLIFADVFAVEYFLETLESAAFDFYDLDDLRVAAFGEAVADRLRFASVHADVIPPKIETTAVLDALLDYIGEDEIGGLKFLYLKSDFEADDLAEKLRGERAEVAELPVYRIIAGEAGELTKLKTLLKGGAVDEFVLTAPTDLIALKNYFAGEKLADVLDEVKISAADAVMFQTAKEHDLRRVGLFHLDKVDKVN